MKVGARFRSQNTTAELIVVKGTDAEVALTCADLPMVLSASGPRSAPGENPPDTAAEDKLLQGKRYVDAQSGIELLCIAAGTGPVAVDGRRFTLAEAKLLPSSD